MDLLHFTSTGYRTWVVFKGTRAIASITDSQRGLVLATPVGGLGYHDIESIALFMQQQG